MTVALVRVARAREAKNQMNTGATDRHGNVNFCCYVFFSLSLPALSSVVVPRAPRTVRVRLPAAAAAAAAVMTVTVVVPVAKARYRLTPSGHFTN